ncbi:MAG: hypothetical protein K6C35_09705 [Eubacterium sp.]|nr:hypothetical protein [Eubacterium sp.]
MSVFRIKKIDSFEKIEWNISGMRITRKYEIINKGDEAEVSEYEMHCVTGGGMEPHLERRVLCPNEKILEILNSVEAVKWDGFHGKHPRGVLDGETFSFEAVIDNNQTIKAGGSANFPKHFRDFERAVYELLNV